MIISRRPKKRESSENAPGPRKTIAAATIATKTADSGALRKFGAGARITENAMQVSPTPTNALAMGVNAPKSNATPPISAATPIDSVTADPGLVSQAAP